MKITQLTVHSVEASPRGNWHFVRLHTDAGISGIGEASQSGNDALVLSALELMGQRLVGCDPTQPEVLWERMVRSGGIFSGDAGRVGDQPRDKCIGCEIVTFVARGHGVRGVV